MNTQLSEEEMREALFGPSDAAPTPPPVEEPAIDPLIVAPQPAVTVAKPAKVSPPMGRKLRVTLQVSNEYEGETFEVHYDASTLSQIVAEMDAKKSFKKKYKYITVVSVTQL
jgi:hypothetical protein